MLTEKFRLHKIQIYQTKIHSKFRILTVTLALLIFTVITQAQSFQGGLRGSIKDSEGNSLPLAALTLTNIETNVVRNTTSNETGEYVFEKVDPGKYKLSANLNGFKKTEALAQIDTSRTIRDPISPSF